MDSRLIELSVELLWPTRYVSPLVQKIYTIQIVQIRVRVGFLLRQLGNCNGNWQEKRKYFINNTVYKGADLRIWPIQQKIVSRKMLLLEI